MSIVGSRNVKIAATYIINSVIVNEERAIGVFDRAMSGEYSVVGFNDSSRDTGGWVDGEFKLRFLAIVGRKSFEEESTKTRSCTTTKRVEDQETLK